MGMAAPFLWKAGLESVLRERRVQRRGMQEQGREEGGLGGGHVEGEGVPREAKGRRDKSSQRRCAMRCWKEVSERSADALRAGDQQQVSHRSGRLLAVEHRVCKGARPSPVLITEREKGSALESRVCAHRA